MRRFWNPVIKPIFVGENIKNIVEIGADRGGNTANLLQYARESGGHLDSIDPCPSFPADEWVKKSDGVFTMHYCTSLEAIPTIANADVFLIDGDHNWYTVYNELKAILDVYPNRFPLVLFHDIGWPYARRDLYYNPAVIPPEYCHTFEKKAIKFGSSDLGTEGINGNLNNAIFENGDRNGVKTAVEDFLNEHSELKLKYYELNIINGLGMIANPAVHGEAVRLFTASDTLLNVLSMAEMERINVQQKLETMLRNSPVKADAKLYFDYGSGFSEENSIKLSGYDSRSGSFVAHAVAPHVPLKIRFDPVGANYCMVSDLIISTENGVMKVKSHNGHEIDGKFIFDIFDSQFILDNESKVRSFDIKANICCFSDPSLLSTLLEYCDVKKCISELKAEIELCRKSELEATINRRELEKTIENNHIEKSILSKRISDTEKENLSLKGKVSEMEKENSGLKKAVSEAEGVNLSLKGKVSDMEEENSCLYNMVSDLEKDNLELKKRVSVVEDENSCVKATILELENENQCLRSRTSDSENENSCLKTQLADLQAENAKIDEKLREDEFAYTSRISEMENITFEQGCSIKKLNADTEEYKKTIESLKIKLQLIEKSNHDYAENAEEQRKMIAKLNSQVSEKQTVLERVRAEADSFKQTVENKQSEISSLNTKLDAANTEAKRWHILCDYHMNESNRHVNSFRYRVGSEMVDSYGSFKKMLQLPAKLIKILKEYKMKGSEKPTEMPALPEIPLISEESSINNCTTADIPDNIPAPISPLTKEDIIKKNREFNRKLEIVGNPLVSIIILNRDGLDNLIRLFSSLKSCVFYNNYEIIIVDNGSTDKSVEFINSEKKNFNITVISNKDNESFSKANNQGAEIAKGDFLLFLNNDIEVMDGWLDRLIYSAQNVENCGAVGAQLIYPQVPDSCLNRGKSFCIQHNGITFNYSEFNDELFIRPCNKDNGQIPFQGNTDDVIEQSAVTAACLLMKKSVFSEIGGYDEQFVYGYEDVDLCLKAHRKGYKNILCTNAHLFHYEFGTQTKSTNTEVRIRRTNNINHFKEKWQDYLRENILADKLAGRTLFTDTPLTVAFAVTEATPDTGAGDYFTALELGQSLEKLGCKIKFLSRRGPGDWYDVGTDANILISMLDCYDLNKVKNTNRALISVAWARNWFERWAVNPSIQHYSLLFASSELGCQQLSDSTGRKVELFPIATNYDRFADAVNSPENSDDIKKYKCDYVFTGSYWNDEREIITTLNPKNLPYSFKVFGQNWDKVPNFAPYNGGFVNYCDIPKVYKYTKIVLDDANRVTKSYGSVNSRVFDAIAAGCIVLTNGALGSEGTFNGALPVYNNSQELETLIQLYMSDEKTRSAKIRELQDIVIKNHTYDVRAKKLLEIVRDNFMMDQHKIAVMVPAPRWSEVESWGDYHFAVALKKCFEQKGYNVDICILPEWNNDFNGKTVIVLRGLSIYKPRAQHTNIMWNISHPDDVTPDEYNLYDIVYVSSLSWADKLKKELSVPVEPMLQCTDPEVFSVDENAKQRFELLFVGNSRKVFRRILKDLLPTKYDLSVFGKNWAGLIDEKFIKGELIPNNQVGQAYHDSAVLLNDHWDDMRSKGFISNRIFDGLAAGAFIISDEIEGVDDVLKDCIITYHDRKDLAQKLDYFISHPDERRTIAKRGQSIVRSNHTFLQRTEQMLKFIETNNKK